MFSVSSYTGLTNCTEQSPITDLIKKFFDIYGIWAPNSSYLEPDEPNPHCLTLFLPAFPSSFERFLPFGFYD